MPNKPTKTAAKKKKEAINPKHKDKVEPQWKSGNVEQGLNRVDHVIRYKLSVPLIAAYLKKNIAQIDIARICGVSKQAVDQFIDRHSEQLMPLIDKDDGIIAVKAKMLHDKAMDRLIDLIDDTGPKDMMALNVVSGTHFDKYRLSTNRSTQNISIGHRFMHLQDEMEVIEITDESG